MELFDFQADAIRRVRTEFSRHRRVVLQLPTGGGKTATAAELIRRSASMGKRSIFCAHLDCLVEDTERRLRAEGLDVARIQAGYRQMDRAVSVCSVQTLAARDLVPEAELVILDECHRAQAPSVRRLALGYPRGYVLGLTATPIRGDRQGLGDVFQAMVCGGSVRELIGLGRLVESDVWAPSCPQPDLAMSIDDAVARFGTGRSTVVFTASVDEAKSVADRLGGLAVDGDMDHDLRREHLARFASGEAKLLCNCSLLTEGWDCPRAEVIIIARSCGHVGAWLQMIGRVLRVSPETGKSRALVVDLRGWVHQYGLPDQDREWELTHGTKKGAKIEAVKTCRQCGHTFRPVRQCPFCGHIEPIAEARVASAEVERIDASKRLDMSKAYEYYRELLHVRRMRGYKPGWVGVRFKDRHGFWPPWKEHFV